MANKVTVTGAVVGKNAITVFLADGSPMQLPQDSWRTQDIMERIIPSLAAMQHPEIDLDEFSLAKKVTELTGVKATDAGDGKVTLHQGSTAIPAAALEMHIERAAVDGSKGLKAF